MRKSGKYGAKTGQEAACCDLRGKVAFCRDSIGVTKVGVETLSPFRLLWTFTTAFPFSFYRFPAESPGNLPEESHKMWAGWVLLLWSGSQRSFGSAWCCGRALEQCSWQSWVLCQILLTSDSEEIAQLMQQPSNVTFSVCCKCLSPSRRWPQQQRQIKVQVQKGAWLLLSSKGLKSQNVPWPFLSRPVSLTQPRVRQMVGGDWDFYSRKKWMQQPCLL